MHYVEHNLSKNLINNKTFFVKAEIKMQNLLSQIFQLSNEISNI